MAVNISEFDQYRVSLVLFKIEDIKNEILENETSHSDWLHKGSRFNDNKNILVRMLSKMLMLNGEDLEKTKAQFLSLNSVEIEPYIKDAILDAASADYYYNFEKDWN